MIYINVNYRIIEVYNKDLDDDSLKIVINRKMYNIITILEQDHDE